MKRLNFLAIALLLIGTSCETIVEVDLPENPPKLVVNSYFNSDSLWAVHVSKSQFVLDNAELQRIENANVKVTKGDGTTFTLSHDEDGFYRSDSERPVLGQTYDIEVTAPDFESVSATNVIPSPVIIESVDTVSVRNDGEDQIELRIKFTDNGATKDYYEVNLFAKRESFISDSSGQAGDTFTFSERIFFESDDLVFTDQAFESTSGSAFTDDIINGKNYQLKLQIYPYFIGGGVPNDPGNPNPDPNPSGFNEEIDLIIELRTVSEDYYKYSTSYANFQWTNGDPFAQPVRVHSNIQNGFGIFAGYSNDRFVLSF